MSTSKLVTSPNYIPTQTLKCDGDAVTMCVEGLADYLLECKDTDGNPVFKTVFSQWAAPSDTTSFPSAVVNLAGEATPDGEMLTPGVDDTALVDGNNKKWLLMSPTGYTIPLRVSVTLNNKEQRKAVARALEKHFNPVVWMCGFRLELLSYHGATAQFLPGGVSFADNAASAAKRLLALVVGVRATVPVVLPVKRKELTIVTSSSVTD